MDSITWNGTLAVITGRIFKSRNVIGYRVWILDTNGFQLKIIKKKDIQKLFDNYRVINCKLQSNCITSTIRIPLRDFPKYDDKLKLKRRNLYTDSQVIAITFDTHIDNAVYRVCGALVSGAITDTESMKALEHAELYYEEIRHMKNDTNMISKNIGVDVNILNQIKTYLFEITHCINGGYKRFDPCFEIAQSWQRLMSKDGTGIQPHDLTLINHEIEEMNLVKQGIDQDTAHIIASNKYDYKKEASEYYANIRKHKKKR